MIDEGKMFSEFISYHRFLFDLVCAKVQEISNYNLETNPLSNLLKTYRKLIRYINMLEEFANENSEQLTRSNSDVNRMYIAQCKQYSLFHSLSK